MRSNLDKLNMKDNGDAHKHLQGHKYDVHRMKARSCEGERGSDFTIMLSQ